MENDNEYIDPGVTAAKKFTEAELQALSEAKSKRRVRRQKARQHQRRDAAALGHKLGQNNRLCKRCGKKRGDVVGKRCDA